MRAGVDGDLVLGALNNYTTSITGVQNSTANSIGFFASSGAPDGTGMGIQGISFSSNGVGVYGQSTTGRGVVGSSSSGTGVEARSTSGRGLEAFSSTDRAIDARSESGWGVYGRSASSHGVHGVGPSATGVGVYGESGAGIAIDAHTTRGVALRTDGRIVAENVSGVATIGGGKRSVTVTPGVDVAASSFVLLTPRTNIGGSRTLWYTTNPTAKTFTIRISSPRSGGTPVAWLLLG